jgi:hypothetical protein
LPSDAVYYALFKCNLRHVYEYPTQWRYARAFYQMPGIAATCDIDECKLHYYGSLRMVNPSVSCPKRQSWISLRGGARVTGPAHPATPVWVISRHQGQSN